jgi:hypothetical protein
VSLERIGSYLSLTFNILSLVGYAYAGKWPMTMY